MYLPFACELIFIPWVKWSEFEMNSALAIWTFDRPRIVALKALLTLNESWEALSVVGRPPRCHPR